MVVMFDHDLKVLARNELRCKAWDLGADRRARSGTLTRNSLVPAPADDRDLEIHIQSGGRDQLCGRYAVFQHLDRISS